MPLATDLSDIFQYPSESHELPNVDGIIPRDKVTYLVSMFFEFVSCPADCAEPRSPPFSRSYTNPRSLPDFVLSMIGQIHSFSHFWLASLLSPSFR